MTSAGPTMRTSVRVKSLLVLAVVLVFLPTLYFGFVDWDDDQYVLANPLLVSSRPWIEHLLTPAIGYPIPLTVASYQLEVWLNGLEHPFVFHLTNVLLHASNVALLLALARRLGAGLVGATFAAALFGLHPVVAEPVAWVTGRKDLLCAFFSLAALLAWTSPISRQRTILVNLLAIAALLSKPTAVGLVPILLVLGPPQDQGARTTIRARLVELLPFVALAALSIPLAYVLHRDVGGLRVVGDFATKAHRVIYALGFHLRLLFGLEVPTVKYAVEPLPRALVPEVDLLPLALAPLVFVLLQRLDGAHRKVAIAGLVIAAFAYVPSSNLVPLYRFLADSYVYLPLAGLALVAGVVVERLVATTRRPAFFGGACVVTMAALLSPHTMSSASRFADSEALFTQAYERYPSSFMLCRNWATSLRDPSRILAATDRCIDRFGPDGLEKNRAIALFDLGRRDEAIVWARRSLVRHPADRSMPPALLAAATATGDGAAP